jgi:hypothetical protein
MKKLTGILLGIVLVVGMAGIASAATSDSITLKISCVVTLSVDIDQDEYNFGDVAARTAEISTDTIAVTNNSGGLTEDYTINCSTATADWNLKTSDPLDTDEDLFSLQALLKSTQALEADYSGKTFFDTNAGTDQNMDIGFGTAAYTGDDVPADAVRNIWFRLHTPGTTTSQTEQSLSVTITANGSGTF